MKKILLLLTAAFLFLPNIHSQIKTGSAKVSKPIVEGNVVKARDEAVLSAQQQIIFKEFNSIISPDAADYFGEELRKLLLQKASSMFFSVNIIEETREDRAISVSLEATYNLETVSNFIESIGLPFKKDAALSVVLAEVGQAPIMLQRHLSALKFNVVKNVYLGSASELSKATSALEANKQTKILVLVGWGGQSSSAPDQHNIRLYFKGSNNPYVSFRFPLSKDAKADTSASRMELLASINRNSLQASKNILFESDKTFVTVKGFSDPAEKITFMEFVFINQSRLFPSFIPDKSNENSFSFNIKIPSIQSWLSSVNAEAKSFRLSQVFNTGSAGEIQFHNRSVKSPKEMLYLTNSAGDGYWAENEDNNSFREFNYLPENRNIYGSLASGKDVDIFRTVGANQLNSIELEKLSDLKSFTVRLKFYNENFQLIKSLVVPQSQDKLFRYSTLGLLESFGALYIKVENISSELIFNIGASRKIQYRLKVNS